MFELSNKTIALHDHRLDQKESKSYLKVMILSTSTSILFFSKKRKKKEDSIFENRFLQPWLVHAIQITRNHPWPWFQKNCWTIAQRTVLSDRRRSVRDREIASTKGARLLETRVFLERFEERWTARSPRLHNHRPTGIESSPRSMIHRSTVTGAIRFAMLATRLIIPSGVQWTVL